MPRPSSSGGEHLVLAGEHLRPAQDDAVDHDQGQEHPQGVVQGGGEGLDEQLHNGDEPRHNGDEGRDAHLVRDDLPQQGDNRVGAHQHKGGGGPHADGVGGGGGHRQGGAAAQHQPQHRVLLDDALGKLLEQAVFLLFHRHAPPFTVVVLRDGLVDGVGHRGGGDGGAGHGLNLALAGRLVLDDLEAALRGGLQVLVQKVGLFGVGAQARESRRGKG